MENSALPILLEKGNWNEFQTYFNQLNNWKFYNIFLSALNHLKIDELFESQVHGLGHIERTLLQGAFCAMEENLSLEDTSLLMDACSYHDVGRISDWLDEEHGYRAAMKIAEITGRSGDDLLILQAAVDAHSRKDSEIKSVLCKYGPKNIQRAMIISELLKDADGLDRVRLGDLNVKYLRRESSKKRAGLAEEVFRRYQIENNKSPEPFFDKKTIERIRYYTEHPELAPKSPTEEN